MSDAAEFKAAMRHFPTGVSIVTTSADGVPKGFTATAIASVSAEPPMVLVCVNRQGRSHPFISQAGVFCVNLLGVEQRELAARFAARRDEDPFAAITHHFERTGAPVIDGALAFLDCTVAEEHSAGTHTIFIGAVQRAGMRAGEPLGYFDGAYRDFGCRIA